LLDDLTEWSGLTLPELITLADDRDAYIDGSLIKSSTLARRAPVYGVVHITVSE